ncbi:MAG: 5-formyltetrahydrofolate cyclo-ligase [Oligoflexales bacterium]
MVTIKKDLRLKYKTLRAQCCSSGFYFSSLLEYLSAISIDRVFGYAGHNGEPDPLSVDWDHPMAIPKVGKNGSMEFFSVNPKEALSCGHFGIREPSHCAQLVVPTAQSVVLVPCVAVDQKGTRLGMGGGYYDRYLSQYRALKIGIVYPEQVSVECLPREEHDVLLDGYYDGSIIFWFKRDEEV